MQVKRQGHSWNIKSTLLLVTAKILLLSSGTFADTATHSDKYCDGIKLTNAGDCQLVALGYIGALGAIAEGQTNESINVAIGQLEIYAYLSERRAKQVVRALINYHDAVASQDDYSFKAPYLGCRLDPGYQLPRSRKERAKCKVSSTMFEHKDWWESHTATDP